MESKQTRLITTLSVIVLALVAFLVFVKPPEQKEENAVTWTRAFEQAKSEEATRVELKLGARSLVFDKKDNAWTVTEASGAALPADRQKVQTLIDDVLTVETSPAVSGSDGHLADFGLDTPAAVVTVTAGTPYTLRVGRDTPVGYGTYVQTSGDGPVVRARSKLSGAVLGGGDGSLSDFRDKALFRWNPADLTALRISRPPASPCPLEPCAPVEIRLSKDAHGWWLDGADRQRASESGLESMLAALTALQADSFAPDMGGTMSPDITLTLTVGGADQIVEISGEDEGFRLVRAPGVPDLARVKGALHEGFTQDADAWLDDRVLPVRGGELSAIDVKLGDGALSATRTAEGWSKPEAESFLSAVGAARIDRHKPADPPQGDVWGAITLKGGEGATEEVKIFQYAAEGSRVAQDSAGGAPFLVPASELKRLTESLTQVPAPAPTGLEGMTGADGMPNMEMLKALQGMSGGAQ